MKDVIEESGGTVDVLVATHRHWDHVSGFVQAADDFARLKVGQVWLGWTENPRDPDAAPLRKQQADALAMLQPAAARMHLAASAEPTLLATVLEFFGAAGAATTDSAMDALRAKGGATLRYCDPKDAPFELSDFGARIYVLGPPRDEAFLKKMLPAKTDRDETYHLAADAFAASVAAAAASLGGKPVLRAGFVTDNGNQILDVSGLSIADAVTLEKQLNNVPGVVTNGLFAIRPADVALLATQNGIRRL